jgi:hypothetical protein
MSQAEQIEVLILGLIGQDRLCSQSATSSVVLIVHVLVGH